MLRNIASVMSLSLLAQAIGFLRTLVIAALFGASINLDAYYLSLIVPALVTGIVGGTLQAGFVPVYVRVLTHESAERAAALRGTVTWVLAIVLLVGSVGALLSVPMWVRWITSGGSDELLQFTTYASRITVLTIVLICISDYLGLVLNCHRRFALAAAAPIANTLVSVPMLLALGPSLTGLAVSVVAGAGAQLLTVSLGLYYRRLSLPLQWRFSRSDRQAVLSLAKPMVPGFLFTQLQLAYVQSLPVMFGQGAVSVFGYASRLQAVVEQVFVIGLGTVLLPHLAELAVRRDRAEVTRLTMRIGIYALLGALALAGGILLLGNHAVQILLARGRFDAKTSAEVARIWLYLALSAFPFTVSTSLSKLVMALGRPAILSITAALLLVAIYGLGSFLPGIFGLAGVAFVVVVAQCLRLLAYTMWLRPYFTGESDAVTATGLRP